MSNLLNVVYLIALVLASPWLVWQGARKRELPRGFHREVSGDRSAAGVGWPVRLVSCGERRRRESLGNAACQDGCRTSGLRVRRLDDDDDRLRSGEEEAFAIDGVLLSARF